MSGAIDFYFEFSSPYGYFASRRIDAIGDRHGREVVWRPYLLGPVMKMSGAVSIGDRPVVYKYTYRDVYRSARLHDIPFDLPDPFPVRSVVPSCAFYWLVDQDPGTAKAFARRAFEAFFVDGHNISEPEVVVAIATDLGIDGGQLRVALDEPETRDRVRRETDAAVERGVFGSPFILVDDEPFWGNDRLGEVERWLETGGW